MQEYESGHIPNPSMEARHTYLLLRVLDELARCGMQHAYLRITEHADRSVLAREPRIRTWSHIDERCAGFFALGARRRAESRWR